MLNTARVAVSLHRLITRLVIPLQKAILHQVLCAAATQPLSAAVMMVVWIGLQDSRR